MTAEGTPNAEQDVGQVLRNAGRRLEPPAEVSRSVRAAVEAQWREVLVQRTAQRSWRRIGWSAAAGFALAALGLWAVLPSLHATGEPMAEVSVAVGSVQAKAGWLGHWQAVGAHQALTVGEELTTASNGRVALALADNLSVRLDHDTLVTLVDDRHVTIARGAIYVDSGSHAPAGAGLQVMTPAGAIHHLGTQYETRIAGTDVRIAVREGRVELETSGGATHRARAGEELTITSAGSVERSAVSPYGARWQWVSATVPTFNIDGRPVADFLTWAARELGCDLVYADAQTQEQASQVHLSGSIAGLSPDDALAAVLPTTPLRIEKRDGQLLVSLSAEAR
jgi:ferric-dicitrate binding protein FerR (iron transport regulator)